MASEKKGASFKLHCGENIYQKCAKVIQMQTRHATNLVQENSILLYSIWIVFAFLTKKIATVIQGFQRHSH